MSDSTPVRFGLLGAGLIAPFHANAIRRATGCELVAVADMNRERAERIAFEFRCELRPSLDALLDDDSMDVICVLTPNHLHHDAVLAAAAAGKHVLVEKPPAMSLKETDAMIAACAKAGVHLGAVLQCRVRRPIQLMKHAIDTGRFGKVLQADAYMKFYRDQAYYHSDPWRSSRRSGAGVTIQHAFHYIDLLQYLAGPAARVFARMTNLTHQDVELEDTLHAFVDFADGASGVVVASTAMYPGTDIRIEINGERGTAIMVGEHMETWRFSDEQPGDEDIRAMNQDRHETAAGGPASFGYADHQIVIEQMARAVRGEGEPAIVVEQVRPTLEMALAMYQSAATGGWASLPVIDEERIW